MRVDYETLRVKLRWNCVGDRLFRDGVDHYEIDRYRFERAASAIPDAGHAVIADIGSFPGYGIWAFRESAGYIGMGKCPDWYRSALHRMGLEWIDCDFESPSPIGPPFRPPDIVMLQEVIEHIRHPKKFLSRLYAWMPSGARLYLTTNNQSYLGYVLKQIAGRDIFDSAMTEDTVYPGHCTYYTLAGLSDLLRGIGFEVISAQRFNFLPPPRFYRNLLTASAKNLLMHSVPSWYATHIEIICQKSSLRAAEGDLVIEP